MGQVKSKLSRNDTNDTDLPQDPRDIKFRVLIIGRANAGKTSILKRVCDTTESPIIYRLGPRGKRKRVKLDPTVERGEHNIEDELIFTNHTGYIFHDSRGFEAGGENELKIVQEFVRRKSRERELKDRLHVIWYCVPMDNVRPGLDLKYFHDICPDKNIPVIAVFTKYDQFRRNMRIKLEDERRDPGLLEAEVERVFNEHYLANPTEPPPFIRLESMHRPDQWCRGLIELTADALSDDVITLMLLAVQKDQNLELSINYAVKMVHPILMKGDGSTDEVIDLCLRAFPSLWIVSVDLKYEEELYERTLRRGELRYRGLGFKEIKQTLISKLNSVLANETIYLFNSYIYYSMIVTILILNHTTLSYALSPRPTLEMAFNEACSQYMASFVHNEISRQFTEHSYKYSILHFTEFILQHRF